MLAWLGFCIFTGDRKHNTKIGSVLYRVSSIIFIESVFDSVYAKLFNPTHTFMLQVERKLLSLISFKKFDTFSIHEQVC